ncbi:MAG: hypothetical protein AAGH79_09285, partial [Bacteroidota bacterium]
MKTLPLFLLLLIVCFSTNRGLAQCQAIIPVIDSMDPAIPAGDSILYLCQEDVLQIDASGFYPENGLFYDQADSTSTFTWTVNNVPIATGQSFIYNCSEGGAFQVKLRITDSFGCAEDAPWELLIIVYSPPVANLLSATPTPYCVDQIVDLFPDTASNDISVDYFAYDSSPFPLPDGTGLSYFTNIFVTEFDENAIVSSTDLTSITASMEHSFLRDLEIRIICPNGQEAILHNFVGQFGGTMLLGIPVESDEEGDPVPGIPFEYTWKDEPDLMTWIEYTNIFQPGTLPPGDYRSFDSLSYLEGCPLNGTWSLEIQDLWNVDNGFIFGWSIQFDSILLSNVDLPLSFEQSPINNINWVTNPAIQSIQNDTAAILADTGIVFQIEYMNDFGCLLTQDYPLEDVLPPSTVACKPCDSLQVFAGPDGTLSCPNPSLLLDGESNLEPNIGLFRWEDSSGNIISDTKQVLINQPGQYFFTVTNPIGNCVKTDSLTIISDISLPIVFAGNDTIYQCVSGSIQLDGSGSSMGAEYNYFWFSDEPINQETTLEPSVYNSGTYYLSVVNFLTGCEAI